MRTFIVGVIVIVLTVFLPAASVAVVIGPFSGRVLDSDTNEPLHGASIFIYSIKHVRISPVSKEHSELVDLIRMYMKYGERPEGEYPFIEYSDLVHSLHIHTDEFGAYEIQSIYKKLEPSSFLKSSTVIVYHPGYQAFIKKIRTGDPDDVFRTKNIIRLERIPPNFDHKAHYHQIVGAMGEMGEIPVIPPMSYDVGFMDAAHSLSPLLDDNADAGGKRMDWNLFIEKSLLRIPFESFCRRFEWENRR